MFVRFVSVPRRHRRWLLAPVFIVALLLLLAGSAIGLIAAQKRGPLMNTWISTENRSLAGNFLYEPVFAW
jgi:hypothetical protein